ncbi:MAG: hypothetical protein OXL37_00480 [Chloroflexota bacterium]|nr:hypothetical protein [Chloroflexota bacterium]MDE2959806.1 hypothetical protein [Chloroflexota bacterium]
MQFAHDISQDGVRNVKGGVIAENIRIPATNVRKQLLNGLSQPSLADRRPSFCIADEKAERSGNVIFVLDLAEDDFQKLVERRFSLQTLIAVNIVVAAAEHRHQLILGGNQVGEARRDGRVSAETRNIGCQFIIVPAQRIYRAFPNLQLRTYPHPEPTILASRHVGLQLLHSIVFIRWPNRFTFALNQDDGIFRLVIRVRREYGQIHPPPACAEMNREFNRNILWAVPVVVNQATRHTLTHVLLWRVIAEPIGDDAPQLAGWYERDA